LIADLRVSAERLYELKSALAGVNLALVEKCRDPDRGTTIFLCLGIRCDTLWAAAEFLVRKWRRLTAEFGDANLIAYVGFPQTEKYAEEYREPIRLSIGDGK
jgi:hypothetical protein